MKIGKREFIFGRGRIYLMGILNITRDSFSDGGRYFSPEDALRHALEMAGQGADVIDIGAESTRPGYQPVSPEEETDRLCRTIELLRRELDIPLSIDTCKARVMDAALSAGGDMGNDIWGLRYEELHPEEAAADGETMACVLARHGKPAVVMHNDLCGRAEEERTEEIYRKSGVSGEGRRDCLVRLREGLDRSLAIADAAGIDRDKLILDPGIGFAKSSRESLRILGNLACLKKEGETWLLAASRKSVLGDVTGLPVDRREEATIATSILAADAGYSFVRVHGVEANFRALRMFLAAREEKCL